MAKIWKNAGLVATFLTKFALLTNEKWHFGGKILWSLSICSLLLRAIIGH